jgi:hypothetical protein
MKHHDKKLLEQKVGDVLGGKEYPSKDDIKPLETPEGVDDPVTGDSGDAKKSVLYSKKITEKPGKSVKETVSNGIQAMKKNENIFDQLYSTIMEDGLDFGDEFPPLDDEGDAGDEGGFEPDGEEGGEDVTITLTSDQVDVLKDVLSQLDDGDEDGDKDIEDLADEEEENPFDQEEEDPFGEAVDAQPVPDSKGKTLQNTNNKVGKVKGKGGKADKGNPKNEPEPKDLGEEGGKSLTGKDNKVKSTVTPGDFMK